MTDNDKNNAETIAFLKKEIRAKENDVHLAAMYGKQLLEERDEAMNRIEALEQEKYSLQLKLETQTQSVKTQTSELESYVKQVNCLQKEIPALEKEISVLKQRNNNCLKEKQDIEKTVEDLQLENAALKSKVTLLEQQIEAFKNVSILNETKCDEDLPDINEYISKIKTLEDSIGVLQYELESTKLSEKRLMESVRELEEAVSDRDKELSSEVQRIANLQETITELQCEIESLKLGQLDVNRQGNSMFAELDDRRKSVEKHYKELSKKYTNVLTNYEETKKELIDCKGQLTILASMTSKKHQDEQIKKLRNMLSDALQQKSELTGKLCKAERDLRNPPQAPVKGDQYNYLRVMNQQAHEKIQKIESELMSKRMEALDFEKRLAGCLQKLYESQEAFQALKSENLKLKHEIKDITSKPDVCEPIKPKVEFLPGYELNPEDKRLAIKENTNPLEKDDIIPGELLMTENGFVQVKAPTLSIKGRMRGCRAPPKSEITHLNVIPPEFTLKSVNKQNEEAVTIADGNSKPRTPENKKIDQCAQQ